MSNRPRIGALVALGLVTASALALQVILTRIFSSVLAYHFSFLAISLSLLGTGAGALVVYIWPDWFEKDPYRALGQWSVWFAFSVAILPILLARLSLAMPVHIHAAFVANLALACALASIPPFAAGVVVALAITRFASSIGTVYAADLVGAGLGAFLAAPVLWLGPAPNLVVLLGVVVALAAVLFTDDGEIRRRAYFSGAFCLLILGLAAFTRILYLDPGHSAQQGAPIGEHWTPLTRAFGYRGNEKSTFALLLYDRAYAPVPVVKGDRLPDWKFLRTGPQSIGYELTGPGNALVIGGGGGRDIYTALSERQKVDVIELNEGVRMVVDGDLGDLSGRPYSRANVSTLIGDGRSALAARDKKYDQIHLGFTDTLSANAAQGFALAENNLYTIEAFHEYFDHLAPMGVLNVSRLYRLVGDEALRVAVLAQAALETRGFEHPLQHMVVIKGQDFLGPPSGTVLLRLEPYTEAELAKIDRLASERGKGVVYGPKGPYRDEWKQLAEASSIDEFCNSYHLNVCPPTDDQPFFFNMDRLSSLGTHREGYAFSNSPFSMLMLTLMILSGLSLIAFVAPLWMAPDASPPPLATLSYFWLIGLGFLLVEITLIQRLVLFLGYPTYALSVVLFALLIFSGVGSSLTSSLSARRAMPLALAGAIVLILIGAFVLQPLLRALIWLPFAGRVAVAVGLVAPIATCLGMAMPFGLRRMEALYPKALPYAWGINGIASVLASVLGVVVAMLYGFTAAGVLAAVCYCGALVQAVWGEWPESEVV